MEIRNTPQIHSHPWRTVVTMSWKLPLVFLFVVWNNQWTQGLEVHLSTGQNPGTSVFNANLGSTNWLYSFDKKRSTLQAETLFQIDPLSGVVQLQSKPNCDKIVHNPFLVFINSRRSDVLGYTNYTVTPLNVFIHGENCFIKYKRKVASSTEEISSSSSHNLPLEDKSTSVFMSLQLQEQFGSCLPTGSLVLSLYDYLPSQVTECIVTDSRIRGLASELQLNEQTGDIRTTNALFCLRWPSKFFHVELEIAFCGSFDTRILMKIMLYPFDFPSASSVVMDYMEAMAPRQRLRRQAGNTPPSFASRLFVENVPEGEPAGYVINVISATDPDKGEAGRITYSLLATKDGRSQNLFSIDPTSGQLSTTKLLDRENIPVHFFLITAMDHGNPSQSGTASLTIYVDDVNDHAPQFESELYSRPISESISVGATVLTVRASDEDSGTNAEVEYSILNPSGANEAFRIEPRLGSIVVRQPLDREVQEFYTLEIQASDKALGSERKTATSVVELTIEDENDNRPQFTKSSYTVEVSEDIDPSGNPVIAAIEATDRDSGPNGMVRYSITSGNYMNTFSIDAITGQLSVLQPLDYEMTPQYRLSVRAQDNGSPYKSNSTTVLVRVIDVNDNDPKFYTTFFQESILENEPVGYTVIRVQAYDADFGENSALIYTLKDPPEDVPFKLDSSTGVLVVSSELDREEIAEYDFIVESRDQGKPPRTATATIQIRIRDVNDNAPIFEPRVYNEIVSEEAYPGSPVIAVTARDRDENARVTYILEDGNVNNAFSIASQMGQGLIRVARVLNYQEQSRYILTVKATDGHLEDTAMVFINISDANTYRPIFQNAPYQLRIPEDTPLGTSIFEVTATDNDVGENARITYTMDDNEAFQINPNTGEITVKKELDREMTSGYTIGITATDHGRPPQSDSTDLEVSIIDINDNFPYFLDPEYVGHIAENAFIGTSILEIHAGDKDIGLNGRIRYTFEGGNSGGGDFKIDPVLGILRVKKELDRERVDNYELLAYAVDRGSPEKSTSVTIMIHVDDINDNAPQFASENMDMFIKENSPIGSVVGSVSAVDPDDGANAEIEYSIYGGPDAGSFTLTWQPYESATISTAIELDYEGGKRDYEIVIRAMSFPLFHDVTVTIHVQDDNDNIPQLQDFIVLFNNYRDHFPTGEIGRIPAHDPDVSDQLIYRFVSGNQANIIHLNERTGMIRLDPRLNSDVTTNATLMVSVDDGINAVEKQCRLFVRLVTEEMLTNSTTVRLNNLDHATFLTVPLYDMFVSALASIIPTPVDNIYIINIQDDTDVSARILNVSFAVRRAVDRTSRQDVFYKPQFLREKVYLQRALLAKLSTLEVLPFDDDLCLNEPCFNFDECSVLQKFGNTSGFLGSDTMLFRPIHPVNQFGCRCPQGFTGMTTGYLCDTEVNLCYSNPCGHNGTCVPHEGGYSCRCHDGFTGPQCNIDMQRTRYDACPAAVCQNGARCVPLIRGGFRCEECPPTGPSGLVPASTASSSVATAATSLDCVDCAELEHRDQFCGLRTRSFAKGSFLMFPSLKRRHRFKISLWFATRDQNALLFYNGRYNEKHDFIALELIAGQATFSFSLGAEEVSRVRATVTGGLSDGTWQRVHVSYFNRTATLTVGETCDTELSLRHGLDLDLHCAGQVTQVLADRCRDPLEYCYRFLDLTGPFQLGGLPSLPTDFQVQYSDFAGCIRDVYIDEEFLDLDGYVFNNRTEQGCREKDSFCKGRPCKHEGVCTEAWDSYLCQCKEGWGGKDCGQHIEPPRQLTGSSALLYDSVPDVDFLPWYNGISFRTHQSDARLMTIHLGAGNRDDPTVTIAISLVNGYVEYRHPQKTLVLDNVLVNDGQWHYLEARWIKDPQRLMLVLDYGQIRMSASVGSYVAGKSGGHVVVGGMAEFVDGSPIVTKGFIGCVKDIRVGVSENSILSRPDTYNIRAGCTLDSPCDVAMCPDLISTCTVQYGQPTCTCLPGRTGPECHKICERYNPCHESAECTTPALLTSDPRGYTCTCDEAHQGAYCERPRNEPCPAEWWGRPICGPCNCPEHRGFDKQCNKQNGQCHCREHHYRPGQGPVCYPCDCYSVGSLSPACDMETGQCQCKTNVVGRRCDECSNKFAEVTLRGCELQYDDCPRSHHSDIWWPRTPLNVTAVHDCPEGATGQASRYCDSRDGWADPTLTSCISEAFTKLRDQLGHLEDETLKMNAFLARNLVTEMNRATASVDDLYLADLNVTYHVMVRLLWYETAQAGLNLTHKQDRNFIQNIVNTIGRLLEPKNKRHWSVVNAVSGGTVDLLYHLERYAVTLAKNMVHLFMQPFDIVHENLVFGLDTSMPMNQTNVTIPKYNNKVRHPDIFDDKTHTTLPASLLHPANTGGRNKRDVPTTVVAYSMFRTIGDLMPENYGSGVRKMSNISLSVNTPVVTINVVSGDKLVSATYETPIETSFSELTTESRTSPQCVYWKYTNNGDRVSGVWSGEGCELVSRRQEDVLTCDTSGVAAADNCSYVPREFVTCRCQHMTSFAVLMDVSSTEIKLSRVRLEIATYVGVSVSLACLLAAFVLFCCLRALSSNMNSIHVNLTFCLLAVQAVFVAGINRTQPEVACRIIAIFLCYFYLCSFFWMFTATLHLYRMLTEIRNIDEGAMRFYYLLGYVIPGIVVGLAVGLKTDQFGNPSFCWIQTDNLIIWSFVGPICFIFACNVAVYIMALRASCQHKKGSPDYSHVKFYLHAGLVLLPLLGVAWVFALLAVNEDYVAFHYLFAVFTCIQGIFVLLAYVVFCRNTRQQLKYQFNRMKGKHSLEESLNNTRGSMFSRSALAYGNDSSLDGGVHRLNIGVSTNSTTSRSTTSKSGSGGLYRPDGYLHTTSSSTATGSGSNLHGSYDLPKGAGIGPYGWRPEGKDPDTGEKRRKHRDSDSDSELSAVEHPDLELASSHSSDDDDEDDQYGWGKGNKSDIKTPPLKVALTPNGSAHKMALTPNGSTLSGDPTPKKVALNSTSSLVTPPPPAIPPRPLLDNGLHAHSPVYNDSITQPPPFYHRQPPYKPWPGEPRATSSTGNTPVKSPGRGTPSSLRSTPVKSPSPPYKHSGTPPLKSDDKYSEGRDSVSPPCRSDSLPSPKPLRNGGSSPSPRGKDSVLVLTHNGSITDSESASSSTSSDSSKQNQYGWA